VLARRIRSIAFIVCAAFVVGSGQGCGLNEFKHQEKRLKPLVERRATTNELVKMLGTNFIIYSKRNSSWGALTNVLDREPASRLAAVRVGAARWPEVLLYSTPEMMTWVFLDEDGRVVDFVVGAQ